MAGNASELIIAAAACVLTNAPSIEVSDGVLSVGDATSLQCVDPERRTEIGALAIARLGVASVSLTREGLANLVRRRVPALRVEFAGADGDVVIVRNTPTDASAPPCYAAVAPIRSGAAISSEDMAVAPCAEHEAARTIRYDRRHGVVRAASDIAAGELLGRVMPPPPVAADTGDALTLEVRADPVRIERTVQAVQPSTGGSIFVRDADGRVFSAPIVGTSEP